MAGFSNRIRLIYYDDVGQVAGSDKTYTYTAGSQKKWDETVTGGSNIVVTDSIDVSAMKSLFILAATRNMTLTINDDGTPDATVNLVAGVPVYWSADVGGSNPLGSVDATSFKVVLAAGANADFEMIVLLDPTP